MKIMRKVIAGILLAFALLIGVLFAYYPPDYLYNLLFRGDFYYNPQADIVTGRDYVIRVWYYPFLRTVPDYAGREEEYFRRIEKRVQEDFPNISLEAEEVSFLEGKKKLEESLEAGGPPDIYFDFSGRSYISPELQVPVEIYFNGGEEDDYLIPQKFNNHFWGWPFLIYREKWAISENIKAETVSKDLLQDPGVDLYFNYHDRDLLLQLLAIYGLERPELDEGRLEEDTLATMKRIFADLQNLREEDRLESSSGSGLLKEFFQEENSIVGPVNPWLKLFIERKTGEGSFLPVDNLIRVYSLNVFRQEPYQGHDHTKAAMETARIICREFSPEIAGALNLEPGYRAGRDTDDNIGGKLLPIIHPEQKQKWEEIVLPVWMRFWEDELTADEAIELLSQ
ncbi:MAG: hypothetical protein ACOC5A_03885 [Halanaerobiales bacterium]